MASLGSIRPPTMTLAKVRQDGGRFFTLATSNIMMIAVAAAHTLAKGICLTSLPPPPHLAPAPPPDLMSFVDHLRSQRMAPASLYTASAKSSSFQYGLCNIVDPLDPDENLGLEIGVVNFECIRYALAEGARHLLGIEEWWERDEGKGKSPGGSVMARRGGNRSEVGSNPNSPNPGLGKRQLAEGFGAKFGGEHPTALVTNFDEQEADCSSTDTAGEIATYSSPLL